MSKFKDVAKGVAYFIFSVLSLLLIIDNLYIWIHSLVNSHSYENVLVSISVLVLVVFIGYFYWYIPTTNVIKRIITMAKK